MAQSADVDRDVESLTDAYNLLDTPPYGRQEDFEDSPVMTAIS
jgi:predicted dithiol-disulfide oxidoreductase (DUF899 family)